MQIIFVISDTPKGAVVTRMDRGEKPSPQANRFADAIEVALRAEAKVRREAARKDAKRDVR